MGGRGVTRGRPGLAGGGRRKSGRSGGWGSSHGDFCLANLHLSSCGRSSSSSSRFFPPRVDSRIEWGGRRSRSKLILSVVSRWWMKRTIIIEIPSIKLSTREGIERNEAKENSSHSCYVETSMRCAYITRRSYAPRDNYRVTCLSLSRLRSPFLRGRLTSSSSPPRGHPPQRAASFIPAPFPPLLFSL